MVSKTAKRTRSPGFAWCVPFALVACSTGSAVEQSEGRLSVAPDAQSQDEFYELNRRVEIEVELAPADFDELRQEGRNLIDTFINPTGPYIYKHFRANATIDGERYEDVDIRKKGYIGSLSADRPSLKLDLAGGGRPQAHLRIEKVTLNNDRQDPSHSRQCLAYLLFAAAGAPAPRCGLAHVVVNGEDLGTYSNVEPIGKPLLERYFADDEGNLYEGQLVDLIAEQSELFQLETNEAANDRSDLGRLITALEADDAEVVERVGALVDLDAFRTFWALETLIGHWDSYSGNGNNYHLYHDPSTNLFYFLPWGTDAAFTWANPFDTINTSVAVFADGRVANRLYALPEQRRAFRDRLAELLDRAWVPERLHAALDAIEATAVDALPEAIAVQRALIDSHPGALRAELAREAPDWVDTPRSVLVDECDETVSTLHGTFGTLWGSLTEPGNAGGDNSIDAIIDGSPLQTDWVGAAGVDPALADGNPRVRLFTALSPTRTLRLDLQFSSRTFLPGVTPLHGIETVGRFAVSDSGGAFRLAGIVGDGAVEFREASMTPGAAVFGSFSARLFQTGCIRPADAESL